MTLFSHEIVIRHSDESCQKVYLQATVMNFAGINIIAVQQQFIMGLYKYEGSDTKALDSILAKIWDFRQNLERFNVFEMFWNTLKYNNQCNSIPV